MSDYIIKGGSRLGGSVAVSGSKNAALPILTACLLCAEGKVTLTNCPAISDVTYTLDILKAFGCEVYSCSGQITVDSTNVKPTFLPCELTGKLRSSTLFLGAALGRFGNVLQCFSGGCQLGARPIDMHLLALSKMGAEIEIQNDVIMAKNSPHGADIFLRFASVGATENIILAAVLAKGTTTITGAAREPEIVDLCRFLNCMGAKIYGAGTCVIIIEGVEKLRGINYNIMGDRIEAATFLSLALATDGEITVTGVEDTHLTAFTDTLVNCGGFICRSPYGITVKRGGHFVFSPGIIKTEAFPGFPTDAQSLIVATLLKSLGTTYVVEQIFDSRFRVCDEFLKMGADVSVSGNTAKITGVASIRGADVCACDLRSGAALVVAALSADGESRLCGTCHINRGYENFVKKLRSLGADIKEVKERRNG